MINIYNEDCVKGMQSIADETIDCVVTDPPYGIDFQSGYRKKSPKLAKIANDKTPYVEWIPEAYRVLKNDTTIFCFCRWDVMQVFIDSLCQSGFNVKNALIWEKGGTGMGDLHGAFAHTYEICLYATKGKFDLLKNSGYRYPDIVKIPKVPSNKIVHPNQKPIALMEFLIRCGSMRGGVVLDPFSGSGATLVAAKELERDAIGFELDPHYCALIKDRLNCTAIKDTLF